jgi:hypothetical protein
MELPGAPASPPCACGGLQWGAGAGRDRLAVWDREEHGERIAEGDWLVSDAERAAAGRETTAERSRALLPGNRERAARQYACGGLPDGRASGT